VLPFAASMSFTDSDRNFYFDSHARIVTNEKGWRMSRANVFAREGSLYFEAKIVKGIPADTPAGLPDNGPQPHVRIGWARREAPLDAPVGFDGYSYAITDTRFDTMHRSRLGKFVAPDAEKRSKAKSNKKTAVSESAPEPAQQQPLEPIRMGDVIGLLITLPSLTLHRKVVAGTYNPAVDLHSNDPDPTLPAPDIIRDRFPVPYRGSTYFEHWEYSPTKPMTAYSDRAPTNKEAPHAHHSEPAMRCLPGSSIQVYRNGVKAGIAFENLLAFLPPASQPATGQGTAARQGFDDGELGYYPAMSVFSGGIAEMNFGPDFWCPPQDLELGRKGEDVAMGNTDDDGLMPPPPTEADVLRPRGIGERYKEQIAEDVLWDIVDEASFFAQDGGYNYVPEKDGVKGVAQAAASGNLKDDPL
jgi:COMPASS component BRE2